MINPDLRFTYHATNIMMGLAEDVLDDQMKKGVFMLIIGKLNELGKRSTDVIGTVWKDSEALPKDVLNAKLNKGETKTTNLPHYNTMCMQWKDNHDVHMLSSCIPDGNVSVM